MKVLQVITSGEAGGAQSHVLALCEALRGEVDTSVAIGCGGSGVLSERLHALDIPVQPLHDTRNSTNPLQMLRASRELQRVIADVKPDIVHSHSSFAGAAARIAARRCGVPLVYTVHGFGFKREARSPAREAAWMGEKLLARWTTRMICVSAYEADLARHLSLPAPATVIHNGLPDVPFRSSPGDEPASVVMVARLAPPKRADLLLDALHLVAAPPPVEIVGDGPLRQELQSHAANLGLTRVTFTGNVAEVAQRLGKHSIFVLLSDHEGLPISILEAMRAGMAIIASRLPGIEELVVHERSGLLVPNEPHAVADAIDRLLHDAQLRAQLGREARARYEREFGAAAMAARVMDVYRELAGNTREPAG